jgi:hypothetical protein
MAAQLLKRVPVLFTAQKFAGLKIQAFRDATPCRIVNSYLRFVEAQCLYLLGLLDLEDGNSTFLEMSINTHLSVDTAQHTRPLEYSRTQLSKLRVSRSLPSSQQPITGSYYESYEHSHTHPPYFNTIRYYGTSPFRMYSQRETTCTNFCSLTLRAYLASHFLK